MNFDFLAFGMGGVEVPPFAVLLGVFFIVKVVLSRAYRSSSEELARPQRSAEEEASLLEAQEAVRRKIAAQRLPDPITALELPRKLGSLKQELEHTVAPLLRPFHEPKLKFGVQLTEPLNRLDLALKQKDCSPKVRPESLPGKLSRGQKALRDSLLFSKPKALE